MQARVARLAPEDSDPLSMALHPPIFETLEERTARQAKEIQEKEISDAIDAEIEKVRSNERRGPKPIKILLLGEHSWFQTVL